MNTEQMLYQAWLNSLPYKEKPSLDTEQKVADWFLCDRIHNQSFGGGHYRTRVLDVYKFAQRMTSEDSCMFDQFYE